MSNLNPDSGGGGGGGGDVIVEESNNNVSVIIGEPKDAAYNPNECVLFTHNWFRKSNDPQQGICLLCERENTQLPAKSKKKIAFSAVNWSTSGLRNHLLTKHQGPDSQKFLEQESKNALLRKQLSGQKQALKKGDGMKQPHLFTKDGIMKIETIHDDKMQKKFDLACVDFCAETFTSFNAIEKVDIILEAVGRDKKVKTRSGTTVSTHTTTRADQMKQDVYNIIGSVAANGPGGISMTTDAWTNKALQSFLSLTVHFINDKMEMLSFVPFVQYMDGDRHTGENLLLRIERFLAKLGLDKEEIVKYISMDNASNNKKCVRINHNMFVAYWCGNHTLALSVSDFFKYAVKYSQNVVILEILKKCQAIAVHVRKSEQHKVQLQEACKATGVQFHLPILANKTMWNSRYDNVDSNLKLKKALLHLSNNDTSSKQNWRNGVLSPVEFEAAEGINRALEPIKKATKLWESENSPTLHLVVRELFNIRGTLKRLQKDGNEAVKEFAKGLQKC